MNNFERPFTFDRVVRILITVAIIVGLYFFINAISGALLPFLVAWLIAYLINPLVEFFQYRVRIKYRVAAITAALLSIVVVLGGLVWAVTPAVSGEISRFGEIVGSLNISTRNIPFLPQGWVEFINENVDFQAMLQRVESGDVAWLFDRLMPGVQKIFSGSISFVIGVMGLFIVILYIIFILMDYDKVLVTFKNLIPPKYKKGVSGIFNDIKVSMNRYLRGQALVAFLVAILYAAGFHLIGLPLGILLGVFIGILNLVPYLQIVGYIPTLLLCLIKTAETGQNFWGLCALAALVFAVVQIIQDGVIVPRVMGRITGLNPAIILLSLSIWGTLMGFVGLIIALPMTTLLLSYYQRFVIDNEKLYEETPPESNTVADN